MKRKLTLLCVLLIAFATISKAQKTFVSEALAYYPDDEKMERPTRVGMTFTVTDEANKLCELTNADSRDFDGTVYVPLKAKGYLVESVRMSAFQNSKIQGVVFTPFRSIYDTTDFNIVVRAVDVIESLKAITIIGKKPKLTWYNDAIIKNWDIRIAEPAVDLESYKSDMAWNKCKSITSFTSDVQPFVFCSEEENGPMLDYTVTPRLNVNFEYIGVIDDGTLYCSVGIESTTDYWNASKEYDSLVIPSHFERVQDGASCVQAIGTKAFMGMRIKKVVIPTSVRMIGKEAFHGCDKLTEVVFPSKDEYDNDYLSKNLYFDNKVGFKELVFWDCISLETLNLPYYYVSHYVNAVRPSESFRNANNLKRINVMDDGYMFYSSDGVLFRKTKWENNSDYPYLDFCPSGRTGSYAIPDGIEYLDPYAFYNTQLESITLPESMKSLGFGAFYGSKNLTHFTIPEKVSIGKYTFAYSKSLEELTSLKTEPGDVDSTAFLKITDKTILRVPVGTKELYKQKTGWRNFATILEIGEAVQPTYKVGDLFTEQTVEGVTMTFRVTSLDPMECEIGDGTQACISTGTSGEVTIPAMPRGFVTRKIADYGFARCAQMTRCWVNDSIWYIGAHAFDGCTKLNTIDLPKNIRELSPVFIDRPVTVNAPATASPAVRNSIVEACERTGSSVMARRTEPKEVEERVYIWPQVRGIEDHFIAYCESVGWIVVDEANPYFDSRNNCNAIIRTSDNTLLFGCKRTTIPETVVAIAPYAFEGHRRLERLTLPAGLQSIGESAFVDCSGITSVKSFIETPFAINDNTFSDVTYRTATLTVPYGTKSLYQATAGWRNFLQIEEMPQTISVGGNAGDPTLGIWYDEEAVEYLAILISGVDAEGDVYIDGYRQNVDLDNPVKVIAIADGAFENNENIKSLRISGTIRTIGRYAFAYCTELKSIYVFAIDFIPVFRTQVVGPAVPPVSGARRRAAGEVSEDAATAFEGIDLDKVTLYVPYGCKSLYAEADGWNQFANIVEMSQEESAINGVLSDLPTIVSNAVYDLQGRRMESSSQLKKGIYIKNGRKVVVK